eukprot:CAMPEP_0117422958 /NCGR_PEP_ID=MMETSP0758-20121206/3707_1 /TAXON_ID=63605 /ORGANISM="Percolomonas cosmopolitus, Strain AE-1 (ATCC 50343)" /LENGTH=297 /DNA_ID=CAMNT_0005205917 /DNA_START=76 /DNA_END=970 /DNA_ORIENTATION=-
MIRIKAKIFEAEHARRFTVGNFQELVGKLESLLEKEPTTVEYDICYKDEEGDWVVVEELNEWEEMLRVQPEGKVLNIEMRRKRNPMKDYVCAQAEQLKQKTTQKAKEYKKTWEKQKEQLKQKRKEVRESESYKKTKEKMNETIEGIQKTFEQFAETGKDAVNEFVDYFTNMMDHYQHHHHHHHHQEPPQQYQQQQQQQQAQAQEEEKEEEKPEFYPVPPTTAPPPNMESPELIQFELPELVTPTESDVPVEEQQQQVVEEQVEEEVVEKKKKKKKHQDHMNFLFKWDSQIENKMKNY